MSDDEALPEAPPIKDETRDESTSTSPKDTTPTAQETNNVKLEDLFNDDDDDDDEYPFSSAAEQSSQPEKTE